MKVLHIFQQNIMHPKAFFARWSFGCQKLLLHHFFVYLYILVLISSLLQSCQSIQNVKQNISEKVNERDSTYLAELQSKSHSSPAFCGGNAKDAVSIARVNFGLGLVDAPALSSYANAILHRVVTVSPQPNCQVKVFILPNNDINTVATKQGGILIPMGLLRAIKTEDELAAILAHEYSHILYQHHNSDILGKTQDSLLTGMDTALAAEAVWNSSQRTKQGRNVSNSAKVTENVFLLSESIIAPAWSRNQEDSADLLGVDLLVAAGYNPSAMGKIMDILQAQEQAMAEQKALRKQLEQDQFRENAFNMVGSGISTDSRQQDVLHQRFWSTVSSGITVLSNPLSSDHHSAEKRKSQLKDYVRTFHRKQRRREYQQATYGHQMSMGTVATIMASYKAASDSRIALAKGEVDVADGYAHQGVKSSLTDQHAYPRLAFFDVRKKQGKSKNAKKNLDYALQRDDAPWSIHRKVIEIYLDDGNQHQALRALNIAIKSLQDPISILPFSIATYKALGENKLMEQSLTRCSAEGIRVLKKSCFLAAGRSQKDDMSKRFKNFQSGEMGQRFKSLINQ